MTDLRVEIDPQVVFDLGESLVSDDITALVELVKNAYDADATTVTVVIDATGTPPEASEFGEARGYITVVDDGTGMDLAEIQEGWLVVARSRKRADKRAGRVTPIYARVPLGDKGLGRLGAQRLGDHLELITSKTVVTSDGDRKTQRPASDRLYIGIDWRQFAASRTLSAVPVLHKTLGEYQRGTRVLVTGLRNPQAWSPRALPALQQRLGQFISPFEEVASFKVTGRLNGSPFDLVDVSKAVLAMATQRVTFAFANGQLRTTIDYRPKAFRSPQSAEDWAVVIAKDDGREFRDWLAAPGGKLPGAVEGPDGWFLSTTLEQGLDRLGGLEPSPAPAVGEEAAAPEQPLESEPRSGDGGTAVADGEPRADGETTPRWADPGPFRGEIYAFDLSPESRRETGLSDYGLLVRSLAGVRVYRDGFAIRPYGIDHDDWLQLGGQWTSGSSYYGLKPGNTVGFVAITAAANAQLREKTNREGFTETAASKNFLTLVRKVTEHANSTNETVRRAYLEFARDHKLREATERPLREPEEVMAEVKIAAADARRIGAATEPLVSAIAAVRAEGSKGTPGSPAHADAGIERLLAQAEELVTDVRRHAAQIERISALAAVLESDLGRLREQLGDFAELAALGLTVETVAHELRNVVDALTRRTRELTTALRRSRPSDAALLAYFEYVRTAMSAIDKQLSHLSPALRYVREARDTFAIRAFIDDFVDFHRDHLESASISLVVDEPFADVNVRMNRGRLTQVLDNLVQNAEYWLRKDIADGRTTAAEIHLQALSGGRLRVWDTGRGFDPAIEDQAFEPFITNKPRGIGRGLGLFIVRQLLQAAGASVELLADRNSDGSRYIIQIDLGGAIDGGGS